MARATKPLISFEIIPPLRGGNVGGLLRLIEDRAPALPSASAAPGPVTAPEPLLSGTPRVLMVDGLPAAVDGALPDGVRLMPLREALEQHDRPIRELAQRVGLGGPSHAFTALNTAFIDRAQVLHVARDDKRLAAMQAALAFFAPDMPVFTFPAWDCLPYDRVSPNADISATRMATLAGLVHGGPTQFILLTTLNAATQRVPAREVLLRRLGGEAHSRSSVSFAAGSGRL